MSAGAAIFVLLVGLLFTLGLYVLIADETTNTRVVDREMAEREAMAQGGRRSRTEHPDRRSGSTDDIAAGWGDDHGR